MNKLIFNVCGALRSIVPFVQFKKHEKHSWSSVTFTPLVFFTFSKLCKYGTKSRKVSHI